MTTITIRRYVEGVDIGMVEKVDGEINCSMTKLLGGTNNAFTSRARDWTNNTYITIFNIHDINVAVKSIENHGYKAIVLEPEDK